MDVDSVRAYCLSFPETTEKLQWGDALCFKVRGKMFAVMGLDRVRLTFKCTPEIFAEMIEREDIGPAPYVGRHNWVMLERLDALRTEELRDAIRNSYEMVVAKAPKKAGRAGKKGNAGGSARATRDCPAPRRRATRGAGATKVRSRKA